MKILHVSPSFYPTTAYGGTIRSGRGLCVGLAELGCDVRVLTTDSDGPGRTLTVSHERDLPLNGIWVRYCHKQMRDSVSTGLLRFLPAYVAWADIVHLTAIYSFPTFPTLICCRHFNKPLVWSPRGSLQRWEGTTRRLPKLIWEISCRRLVQKDKLILHTTSPEEAEQTRKRLPGIRTAVVRNGVESPESTARPELNEILQIAYLGRLHPIKGIECLLEACHLLNQRSIRWCLNIAGAGPTAYVESLRKKTMELGLSAQVEFLGEVFHGEKSGLFAESDLVVVPSHVENFGMVVAEALAHGVPVIASTGTPWRDLDAQGCGLWVSNEPQALAAAIDRIRLMPLRDMGLRGRRWMQKDFSWNSVARDMLTVYRECVENVGSLNGASHVLSLQ